MAEHVTDYILGYFVAQGLLLPEQEQTARAQLAAGTPLQQVLVAGGLVDEEVFAKVWAVALQIPYVDLRDKTIPREILSVIPESTAREHLIIAYDQTPEGLKVAITDPGDRQIIEFVRKKVDMSVDVALASESSVRAMLHQYQGSLASELRDVVQGGGAIVAPVADLSKAVEDAPIMRVTDAILRHAIAEGASDIHIEPMEAKVLIRYRIDGILHDVLEVSRDMAPGLVARIKVLSNLKIDEHRLPQDGRFKLATDEYNVAFRVSVLPVYDGEKLVMRLLDESGHGLGLNDLGLREKQLAAVRANLQRPYGMILITGPTGSGKTTTLYGMMKELSTPDVNISTIEDPIEYRMERVNQTQVKPHIGLTFANGLRALVRQDPDIIMVGEIRDEETASLAVNAALTGHLVLSTLHTNTAAGALPRLVDMKVEAFLLASTLNVVIAQRLVRRLCDKCRKEVKLDKAALQSLQTAFDMDILLAILQREKVVPAEGDWGALRLYKAVGCARCREGYKGRLGIYEVLEVTPAIQKLLAPETAAAQLEEAARKDQAMVTMLEDGVIKALQGITSLEEVLRVAQE